MQAFDLMKIFYNKPNLVSHAPCFHAQFEIGNRMTSADIGYIRFLAPLGAVAATRWLALCPNTH